MLRSPLYQALMTDRMSLLRTSNHRTRTIQLVQLLEGGVLDMTSPFLGERTSQME